MTPERQTRLLKLSSIPIFGLLVAWIALDIASAAYRDFEIDPGLAERLHAWSRHTLQVSAVIVVIGIVLRLTGVLPRFSEDEKKKLAAAIDRSRKRSRWTIVLLVVVALLLVFLFNVFGGLGMGWANGPPARFVNDIASYIIIAFLVPILYLQARRDRIAARPTATPPPSTPSPPGRP